MKRTTLILVLMLALGNALQASPIGITLTATVNQVNDPSGFLGNAISVGDAITAKYVYDTAPTSSYSSGNNAFSYEFITAPYGIVVRDGGMAFQTSPTNGCLEVDVMHDFTFLGEGEASLGDCLYLESYSNLPLPDGTPVNAIFLKFSDPDGGAIDSTALPTSAPDLGDWQSCTLSIQGPDEFVAEGQPFGHMFDIEAAVTSATLSADPYDPLLPEPGTLPLLGVGFAALAWHGKLTFARSDKSTLAHEDEVRIKV